MPRPPPSSTLFPYTTLFRSVLAVTETADVSDLWRVRRLPDQRSTGDLAQQPLRELGGWSSPQLGRDTVYVQQLPLPGPGRVGVLRLHGLTEPIRVSLDGGEETLVSPAAPVIVLGDSAGESGEVEVAIRAPHVSGGLLDRVELLRPSSQSSTISARWPRRTSSPIS